MRYVYLLERISSIKVCSVLLGKCDIVIDKELFKKWKTLKISEYFEDGSLANLSETEWSHADPFIRMYLPTHNVRQDGSYRIWVEFNRGDQLVKFTTHSNIRLGGKMVPMTAKLMEMTRGQIQNMEVK